VRAGWLVLALILTALPGAAANVEVRVNAGRVDLKLPGAALSEVLARLSSALGFKLTREDGVPDPYLPALEFKGRTPVEAVLSVLDGQGLNYAITMDASGATVESLLLTATKPPSDATTAASRLTPSPGAPRFPRMGMPPPDANDDANVPEPPDVNMPGMPDDEPAAPPPPPAAPPSAAPTPQGPRPMRLPQPYNP